MIDWRRSAQQTYDRFRGFNPWPGAYTMFRGQQLSMTGVRVAHGAPKLMPGECAVRNRSLVVGCGSEGALEILEVQLAGKKRMTAAAFLNGYPLKPQETLGVMV